MNLLEIYVDADACPVKEALKSLISARSAEREALLFAEVNRVVRLPDSETSKLVVVEGNGKTAA